MEAKVKVDAGICGFKTSVPFIHLNPDQKEIGAVFGVDYSTVSQNRVRLKTKLKSNWKLKKQNDPILIRIERLSNPKI